MNAQLDGNNKNYYLTFNLNGQLFGMPIDSVREIVQLAEITQVPDSPICVVGVTKIRERIVPVVDLRVKFNLAKPDLDRGACVITLAGPHGLMGTLVESVQSVIQMPRSSLERPDTLAGRHLIGLAKLSGEVLILIDIIRCLSLEELSALSELPGISKSVGAVGVRGKVAA